MTHNTIDNAQGGTGAPPNLYEEVKTAIAASKNPQGSVEELLVECQARIEEIVGRGIGLNGEEKRYATDRLSEPGAEQSLALLVKHLRSGMARITDPTMRKVADAYADIGETGQAEIIRNNTGEQIDLVRLHENDRYQLDTGAKNQNQELNGIAFEDRLLYPEGVSPRRPSFEEIRKMERAFFEDRRNRELKEQEVLEEARRASPYADAPHDPSSIWLSDMMFIISDELGLDRLPRSIQQKTLTVFPCVGERADILLGADCIFEYTHPQSGEVVHVTLDLSLNTPKKLQDGWKADILITSAAAYVNRDLGIRIEYADHDLRMIDAAMRNERRQKIGKAIAAIIRERLKQMRDGKRMKGFRLPSEIPGNRNAALRQWRS